MNTYLSTLSEHEVQIPCPGRCSTAMLQFLPERKAWSSSHTAVASLERLQGLKELLPVSGATHLFAEPDALVQVTESAAAWFESNLTNIYKQEYLTL